MAFLERLARLQSSRESCLSVLPRMAQASPFSGRKRDGLLQFDDCLVELARSAYKGCQAYRADPAAWDPFARRDSAPRWHRRPVFEFVGKAEVIVKLRIVGIEGKSLLEVLDRFVEC